MPASNGRVHAIDRVLITYKLIGSSMVRAYVYTIDTTPKQDYIDLVGDQRLFGSGLWG